MADFKLAYTELIHDEGGYANDPNDRGGETYRGIARKFWPDWSGWQIVDSIKPEINKLKDNQQLQQLVQEFYQVKFWRFDGLVVQWLANRLFSLEVNMGFGAGVKILQKALRSLPAATGQIAVTVDGHWGPQTEEAANNASYHTLDELKQEFRAQQAVRYAEISGAKSPFLVNWMRRAVE